jgi:hypothetical protein
MKTQLIECKQGKMKIFGHDNILCTLFFDRVPTISSKVCVDPCVCRTPCMAKWSGLILRLGGGWISNPYDDEFFHRWERQVIATDDYPYKGINFS